LEVLVLEIVNEHRDKDTLTSPPEEWTTSKFKDEFFLNLVGVIDTNTSVTDEGPYLSDRKYYVQAKRLIYWIPITKNKELVPPFVINLSDLTPKVSKELKEFIKLNNEKEVNFLLKQIATKFFENINHDYTHDSVLPDLIVRLEN